MLASEERVEKVANFNVINLQTSMPINIILILPNFIFRYLTIITLLHQNCSKLFHQDGL